MGIFFKRRSKEIREDPVAGADNASLLRALLEGENITKADAMSIPSVSACVNLISDTISSLNVKLYRMLEDKVEEVDDGRVRLLNEDTGDTLDGVQFKKAMIVDMFLGKGAYAYVHRSGSEIKSIHYVESEKVGYQKNSDPIFKDYKFFIEGRTYEGWNFIKLFRHTSNGYYGIPIFEESKELLGVIHSSQKFEKTLVKTGGNKKGFIQSTARLTKEAMIALKEAFRNLYSNNTENVVVLNEGLSFKESGNSSVELQLNENKKTNNAEVCKIFLVPPTILEGKATAEDKKLFYENCIYPILVRFATALNRVLLTEDEKSSLFFAFDDSDLTKSDIEKRFQAYKLALDSGFMQLDEVRKLERMPAFGLDFIKLSLKDVLYYPETGKIFTPNTGQTAGEDAEGTEDTKEGGESIESGDQSELGGD